MWTVSQIHLLKMVLCLSLSQQPAMSSLEGGVWKSSEKTSPVLIVLIVFVSLLLAEESSYPTDENLRGFLVKNEGKCFIFSLQVVFMNVISHWKFSDYWVLTGLMNVQYIYISHYYHYYYFILLFYILFQYQNSGFKEKHLNNNSPLEELIRITYYVRTNAVFLFYFTLNDASCPHTDETNNAYVVLLYRI